jgi:hypothetical protein
MRLSRSLASYLASLRVEFLKVKLAVHCHCAILAVLVACLGGPAAAAPVGIADNFEGNAAGSFPAGWSDIGLVSPGTTPNPSVVVVSTTDAFGNPTKALAPVPAIAPSQSTTVRSAQAEEANTAVRYASSYHTQSYHGRFAIRHITANKITLRQFTMRRDQSRIGDPLTPRSPSQIAC